MNQIVRNPVTGGVEDVFQRAITLSRAAEPTLAERRDRLARLRALVVENETRFDEVISADFGNRSKTETLIAETLFVLAEIKHATKNLSRWMAPHVMTDLRTSSETCCRRNRSAWSASSRLELPAAPTLAPPCAPSLPATRHDRRAN